MKPLGVISISVLFLLLGSISPGYAQHEEHAQQANHSQQPQHAQQAQRAQQPQHAQQAQRAQQPQHAQQAQRAQQPQHAQQTQRAQQPQHAQQAQRSQPSQHTQQARGGRQGRSQGQLTSGRIPNDRFRSSFGREHRFRVNRVMYAGNPRFQYGGYWFGFGQPWPVGWYYTDDCYIDYMDEGYYLYNPVHPGVRIAVRIEL